MKMGQINIIFLRSGVRGVDVPLGAERIVISLVKGLNREKFRVVIAVLVDSGVKETPLIREAKRHNLQTEVIELKGRFDISSIFKLRKIIQKYNVDILHSQEYKSNIVGFLATRFMKIKILSTFHGWTSVGLKVKFYELLDLIVIKFFHKIIAVSNSVKNELMQKKISFQKITVIQNTFDYNNFKKSNYVSDLKKSLNIDDKMRIIGSMGRLSIEKGYKYFIEAASEVLKYFPHSIFLIMGGGYLKKTLESYIRRLKLDKNVKLLGYRKDICEFLSLIEIYVSSSVREGFGLALIEAMAFSKPIVATSVGIAPEVVLNNKTGILIRPKDSSELSNGIIKLLQNKALSEKMAQSAKRLIKKKFSLQNMIRKYEEVYLDILREK